MKATYWGFVGIVLTALLFESTAPVKTAADNGSAAPGGYSRIERFNSEMRIDQYNLVGDIGQLRRHLQEGATQLQITKDRSLVRRDWLNIVADRGTPAADHWVPTGNLARLYLNFQKDLPRFDIRRST